METPREARNLQADDGQINRQLNNIPAPFQLGKRTRSSSQNVERDDQEARNMETPREAQNLQVDDGQINRQLNIPVPFQHGKRTRSSSQNVRRDDQEAGNMETQHVGQNRQAYNGGITMAPDDAGNINEPADNEATEETVEVQEHPCNERTRAKNINPQKRTRGPTKLMAVHARKLNERPSLVLNSYGQVVGPTEKLVSEFGRFLGTLARDPELLPLNCTDWPSLPEGTFDRVWSAVTRCYLIHPKAMKCVHETVDNLWRVYKSRTKADHYYAYDNDEDRWTFRPKTIPEEHYVDLLNFWNLEYIEEQSKKNRANRAKHQDVHTRGPRPFAYLRHQMVCYFKLEQADPQKRPPTQAQMYMETRKRDPKRTYKAKYDKIQQNMENMNQLASSSQQTEGGTSQDPYYAVMKKSGRRGQADLHGRGVTQKSIQNKATSKYLVPEEFMQSIKSDFIAELVPDVAKIGVSQIQAANPSLNIEVPEFRVTLDPGNASRGQISEAVNQNGPSSPSGTNTVNLEVNTKDQEVNIEQDDDAIVNAQKETMTR